MTNLFPKNHTISKVIAQSILRLFFVFFALILAFYVTQDASRLQHIQLLFENKWVIAFPLTLLLLFVALVIVVLRERYRQPVYNWLMAWCGVFLLVYLTLLSARVYALL